MAIIYSYPRTYSINEEQLLLISDNRTGKPTKNIGVGDLIDFIPTVIEIQDFKLYGKKFCSSVTLTGNDLIMYVNNQWCKGTISGGSYINADYSTPGTISLDLSATGLGNPKSDYFLRGDNTWAYIPASNVNSFSSQSGVFVSLTDNVNATGDVTIGTVDLSATGLGSPSENYFLRGDNTWAEVSLDVNYDSTLTPTLEIQNDIGGFEAGTTVADLLGTPLIEMWDTLLFPTLLPTYTIPTRGLSSTITGIQEVGTSISPDVTATYNKNDAGDCTFIEIFKDGVSIGSTVSPSTSPLTDILPQFGFPNPNTPNEKFSFVVADNIPSVPVGNTTYTSNANYNAGNPKQDSKGTIDSRPALIRDPDAPQAADTGFGSGTQVINGIYPYWWYTSASPITPAGMAAAIQAGNATKIVQPSTSTISVPFLISNVYIAVAYPATSTSKTTYFVTPLNQGAITVIFDPLGPPVPVTSPNGFWANIDYKIHVSTNVQTSTETPLQLRN